METSPITANYSKAAQQTNLRNSRIFSDTERVIYVSQTTQTKPKISIKFPNHALDRLDFIRNDGWYQEEGISRSVFQNSEQAIEYLDAFIRFLDPEEIGPSGNGTLIMNFENDDISLVLEIGTTTVAHVYMNGKGEFISGSSTFNDAEYWDQLID